MAAKKASKPKVIVQARVDPDDLEALDRLADAAERSRSELIAFAIRDYIQHQTELKSASDQRRRVGG